jgi:hypothetical protein
MPCGKRLSESRMREIRTYGSMRGLQTEAARGPVRSSRVRRTVLDHSSLIPLRSTLPVRILFWTSIIIDTSNRTQNGRKNLL